MYYHLTNPETGKPFSSPEELWKYADEHRSGNVMTGAERMKEIKARKAKVEAEKLAKLNTIPPLSE